MKQNNYDNIRRKAYNIDNPVQAKRSSGQKTPLPHRNSVVQPAIGVERVYILFTPNRFASLGVMLNIF